MTSMYESRQGSGIVWLPRIQHMHRLTVSIMATFRLGAPCQLSGPGDPGRLAVFARGHDRLEQRLLGRCGGVVVGHHPRLDLVPATGRAGHRGGGMGRCVMASSLKMTRR